MPGVSEVIAQVREVAGDPVGGGFQDDRRPGGAGHLGEHGRVDVAGFEVGVPVAAGVELVAGVVQVHQVDAAGDRLDPFDEADEVLTAAQA